MRILACAIVWLWLFGTAEATTLYRCVATDGMVSYQDAPCAGGSTESRRIPVLIEPVPEARPTSGTPAKSAKLSKTSKPSARKTKASESGSRAQARLACTKAREERDAA